MTDKKKKNQLSVQQRASILRVKHALWSERTFGDVGPVGALKHLAKELQEVQADPTDLTEWADVWFLVWDAQRRAGITDADLLQAACRSARRNFGELDFAIIHFGLNFCSKYRGASMLIALSEALRMVLDMADGREPLDGQAFVNLRAFAKIAQAAAQYIDADIIDAAEVKLDENIARTWPVAVDGQPCEHIREGGAA